MASETFTCERCAFTWKTGENGSHDCAGRMFAELKTLRDQAQAADSRPGVVLLTRSGAFLYAGTHSSFAPGGTSSSYSEVKDINQATVFSVGRHAREARQEAYKTLGPFVEVPVKVSRSVTVEPTQDDND